MNPSPIPIKIYCTCGQKYAFEVHPEQGRMPVAIACPVCQRDGTEEANRIIAKVLNGKTQPMPPPSVNALLSSNSVQSSLAPYLVEAIKNAVVKELAAQRRALLTAQQTASAELTALVSRLESVQTPLMERLRTYESRIVELERDLADQSKENRELLKLKIEMLKEQVEAERTVNRLNLN